MKIWKRMGKELMAGHFLKGIFIAFILFSVIMPSKPASAAEITAHQDFSNKLSVELTNYTLSEWTKFNLCQ
jgi:hypothetical protein